MFYKGQGVPQDYVRAYKWASLAGAKEQEASANALEILEKKMSTDQIRQAKQLVKDWKPK